MAQSTIVTKFWEKKFKRTPAEAVLVDTLPFGEGAFIQKVMVRDGSSLHCVLVMQGKGKAQRIFVEQD